MNQQISGLPTPELPPEVAEEWALLHEEARARYQDLAPRGIPLRVLLFAGLAVLILLVVGVVEYKKSEVTRRAEATAQAIAYATAIQQTAQAEAGATATARARELASAAEATAQAQQTALALTAAALDATATARAAAAAATATQQAQDLRCRDIGLYALAAITEPLRIQPPPGFVYVSGNPKPRIFATWVVTNTGECPWESVQLVPLRGGDPRTPVLRIDRKEVSRVAPGQVVEVELLFDLKDAERAGGGWVIRIDQEWVVRVKDLTLFDQPHLMLKIEQWVVIVMPTPIPTPSPTPTPPTEPPPTEPPTPTPIPAVPLFSHANATLRGDHLAAGVLVFSALMLLFLLWDAKGRPLLNRAYSRTEREMISADLR